jgi:hypothetical protein
MRYGDRAPNAPRTGSESDSALIQSALDAVGADFSAIALQQHDFCAEWSRFQKTSHSTVGSALTMLRRGIM